ncbi:nuclear transport factor 2 family protein [Mycobacterium vicinigordonae]|uniref:Nuclear transport factor 2 family protein n=1 Tax=Mycobacterium vicinigordonae TaxID=1719132 RepID=A0A7D6HSQ7_9MYCO|nr:nuclear transport factor 2 family protein [Mycobacterium vicinigordonae]QLL06492.1 nuclear transport factor 2 family protein [Mycobacterium vicinigordonae]
MDNTSPKGTQTRPTSNGADVVNMFLSAFAAGDIEAAVNCLDSKCLVNEAHGLPFSGTYVGQEGFLSLLGAMSADLDASVDKIEVLDSGDSVVGRIALTFVAKTSGDKLATTGVDIYQVRDGKIVDIDVYYKDPGAVAALVGK